MTRIVIDPGDLRATAEFLDHIDHEYHGVVKRLVVGSVRFMPPHVAARVASEVAQVSTHLVANGVTLRREAFGLRRRAALAGGEGGFGDFLWLGLTDLHSEEGEDARDWLLDLGFGTLNSIDGIGATLALGLSGAKALAHGKSAFHAAWKSADRIAGWNKAWARQLGWFGKGVGTRGLPVMAGIDAYRGSASTNVAGKLTSGALTAVATKNPVLGLTDLATGGAVRGTIDIFVSMGSSAITGSDDFDRSMEKAARGDYGWLFKGASDFGGLMGEHHGDLGAVASHIHQANRSGENGRAMQVAAQLVDGADDALDKLNPF